MSSLLRSKNPIKGRASALPAQGIFLATLLAVAFLCTPTTAVAQSPIIKTPAARIAGDIDASQRIAIQDTHPPLARAEFDASRVPAGNRLQGMTLVFNRSAAQQADLQALLSAQQDPSSALYHHWLTPEDFAARFGVADTDIAKAQFWLQQQGFSVDSVSRSKTRITFSGSVAQAEQAFATEMHYYQVRGVTHYAPSTDLSLPVALAPIVTTVENLATFRPHPHIVRPATLQRAPSPNFTSSQSGNHFLDPDDIATIYDIKPAYNAGYTGSGQSIAVVGQSSVVLTDIENFQKALSLTVKDPTEILVPNSGTAAISTGDESESDLDLEYSGAIARGATIIFVYTGNSPNYNVTNAIAYAVDHNLAPIISTSYGDCESDTGQGFYNSENDVLMQAATQGQSVIAAAGDAGSTDCSGNTGQSTAEQEALAVDFPASSQYVTAMGGSEFPAADVASTNSTYWTPAPNSTTDVLSSALSYIPEQVWNDDSAAGGLSSGGGGTSIFTARPSWQANVPGIPSGSFRLVPDISMSASPNNAAFLYCSSDSTVGVTGSCSNGFRDANNVYLTTAGGTSFDVPIFAGMVAIINQKTGSTGQGVVASTLYKLASNSTTYASAFHDISTGSNECLAGATLCSTAGESSFLATTGYDEASGLGSVDFYNLLNAWPGSTTAPAGSFTLTAATATVSAGSSVTSLVTITPANGFTGTVNFTASVSPASADICFTLPSASVTGATAVTATLTVFTSSSSCGGNAVPGSPGAHKIAASFAAPASPNFPPANTPLPATTLALASMLGISLLSLRSSKLATFSAVLLFVVATGAALSGCSSAGSSNNNTTSTVAAKGTYTITIVGTDSADSSITATTSATLTID
jgi:subtilase family serine protease